MSNSTNKYMLHWLHDGPSQTENIETAPSEDEDEAGLAARLYRACLHVMRYVHRRECSKSSPQLGTTSLENCLSKLFLWGDEFGVGDLDKALDQSDELRESVLEQLLCVGGLLLRGKLATAFRSIATGCAIIKNLLMTVFRGIDTL